MKWSLKTTIPSTPSSYIHCDSIFFWYGSSAAKGKQRSHGIKQAIVSVVYELLILLLLVKDLQTDPIAQQAANLHVSAFSPALTERFMHTSPGFFCYSMMASTIFSSMLLILGSDQSNLSKDSHLFLQNSI